MTKTFLEWSVADKKAQQEKWAKEMLRIHQTTKVEWIPRHFLAQNGIYIPEPERFKSNEYGNILRY